MRRYTPSIIAIIAFVLGCAAAPLVIPPLAAQQQAPRWEYFCVQSSEQRPIVQVLNSAGREGWELTATGSWATAVTWCFKRPL
jgi:hypothetical protein